MVDTKEKILFTALRLFARDGYEAASVSDIAGELGMTKGALYKHYKNKHDIFASIVERMYLIDIERAKKYKVPEETFEKAQMRKKYRALVMGRTGEKPDRVKRKASVEFDMKKANRHYDDPFEQAEYTYSRIRSKDER